MYVSALAVSIQTTFNSDIQTPCQLYFSKTYHTHSRRKNKSKRTLHTHFSLSCSPPFLSLARNLTSHLLRPLLQVPFRPLLQVPLWLCFASQVVRDPNQWRQRSYPERTRCEEPGHSQPNHNKCRYYDGAEDQEKWRRQRESYESAGQREAWKSEENATDRKERYDPYDLGGCRTFFWEETLGAFTWATQL